MWGRHSALKVICLVSKCVLTLATPLCALESPPSQPKGQFGGYWLQPNLQWTEMLGSCRLALLPGTLRWVISVKLSFQEYPQNRVTSHWTSAGPLHVNFWHLAYRHRWPCGNNPLKASSLSHCKKDVAIHPVWQAMQINSWWLCPVSLWLLIIAVHISLRHSCALAFPHKAIRGRMCRWKCLLHVFTVCCHNLKCSFWGGSAWNAKKRTTFSSTGAGREEKWRWWRCLSGRFESKSNSTQI